MGKGLELLFDAFDSVASNLIPAADNTYDIGTTSLAWKDLNLSAGGALKYSGRTQITSPAIGNLLLRNAAGTDFGLVQFGGTTSSFPALKRNGAGLDLVAADDTQQTGNRFRARSLVARADQGNEQVILDGGILNNQGGVTYSSHIITQWSSGSANSGSYDVALRRSAANVLRLSGTSTSATSGASLELFESAAAPAAPAADGGRIFLQDNGGGKTQLCVRFATGAVQVIATEP